MTLSMHVTHAPIVRIRIDDAGIRVKHGGRVDDRGKDGKQRATLQAKAVQSRIKPGVADVEDTLALRCIAIQPINAPTMPEDFIEQAHFPQDLQTDRLQQQARANRSGCCGLFEHLNAMPIARKQNRCGLARRAQSDDCNAQARKRHRVSRDEKRK